MKKLFLLLKVLALFFTVVMVHLYSAGDLPGQSDPQLEADWDRFSKRYGIAHFGRDGYFVRAIRHGHSLVNRTYDFAWRFTRKKSTDSNNSCASCHTPEDLAFAFVKSDRFDSKVGRRLSFEEQVMRCYIKHLDGFMPTIYDPAIRDIRIYARAVAHHYQLVEGSIRRPDGTLVADHKADPRRSAKQLTGKASPASAVTDRKPDPKTADRRPADQQDTPAADRMTAWTAGKSFRALASKKNLRKKTRVGIRPRYRGRHSAKSRRSLRRKSRLKRARYRKKRRRGGKRTHRRSGS